MGQPPLAPATRQPPIAPPVAEQPPDSHLPPLTASRRPPPATEQPNDHAPRREPPRPSIQRGALRRDDVRYAKLGCICRAAVPRAARPAATPLIAPLGAVPPRVPRRYPARRTTVGRAAAGAATRASIAPCVHAPFHWLHAHSVCIVVWRRSKTASPVSSWFANAAAG